MNGAAACGGDGLGVGGSSRTVRRAPRESSSFMSPGDDGDLPTKNGLHPFAHVAIDDADKCRTQPVMVHYSSQRSPEIKLEFKHDSLLKSLPDDFLRYGRGSATSLVDDTVVVKPPFFQVSVCVISYILWSFMSLVA